MLTMTRFYRYQFDTHTCIVIPMRLRSENKYTVKRIRNLSDQCLRIKIKFIGKTCINFTKVQNFTY